MCPNVDTSVHFVSVGDTQCSPQGDFTLRSRLVKRLPVILVLPESLSKEKVISLQRALRWDYGLFMVTRMGWHFFDNPSVYLPLRTGLQKLGLFVQNQKGFYCQEGFYTNKEFVLVNKVHTLRQ
jgi:hypothetical protein